MPKNLANIRAYTTVLGIAIIVIGLIMMLTFPVKANLPEGFITPIIAFEFAKTEQDLSYLSGASETQRLNREKMNAGLKWDMAFPFVYGGFLLLLLIQQVISGRRIAWLGIPFAALIIPFDINENLRLLDIISALNRAETTSDILPVLHTATWLKWGAIGLAIGVFSITLVRDKSIWLALLAAATSLSIAGCWVTNSNPYLAEGMTGMLSLFFVIFVLRECVYLRRASRSAA